jgi:hypothetical protein
MALIRDDASDYIDYKEDQKQLNTQRERATETKQNKTN